MSGESQSELDSVGRETCLSNYNLRENGFALFNGKVDTSEKECYEVASSEVDWDMHTVITKYGKDIDNLWPDLSKSRSENYFEGTSISLWWPNRDENGNTLVS